MAQPTENPLISSTPSETRLTVSLHPLALLTISDQITRQRVRDLVHPVAGALLGQQRGRQVTAEHAFPVELILINAAGDKWEFPEDWMETRIQQCEFYETKPKWEADPCWIDKDVHKSPALELVGWYALCSADGPGPDHVVLQKRVMELYNDSAILLAFHPDLVKAGSTTNGKLPVSIYEMVEEVEHAKDDASMQVDGEENPVSRFRHVPYTIETDETEMIAIDYVAKGAGTATALDEPASAEPSSKPVGSLSAQKKGKKRANPPTEAPEQKETNGVEEKLNVLTLEEEDQIASITTRLNSVNMLQSRIALLRSFIQSLPPSYLSEEGPPLSSTSLDPAHLPHLRNIQALLTRLSLLTPVDSASSTQPLTAASQAQANDVALVSMLALLGQDIQALHEVGRKFSTVESNRGPKSKLGITKGSNAPPGGAGVFSSLDDSEGRFGGVSSFGGGGMTV